MTRKYERFYTKFIVIYQRAKNWGTVCLEITDVISNKNSKASQIKIPLDYDLVAIFGCIESGCGDPNYLRAILQALILPNFLPLSLPNIGLNFLINLSSRNMQAYDKLSDTLTVFNL